MILSKKIILYHVAVKHSHKNLGNSEANYIQTVICEVKEKSTFVLVYIGQKRCVFFN